MQLNLVFHYLDDICNKIAMLKNDSAIHSISTFITLMIQDYIRNRNQNYLTENQLEKINENRFD